MARKTTAQATDKWKRRTAQAAQDYSDGIANAQNWSERAVQAAARRNQGLQAAIADGRIDAGIRRVGDQGWKNAAMAKGPTNWTQGVAKSGDKYAAGMQRAAADQASADSAVAGMDRTTVEGRVAFAAARALAVHKAAISRKQSGG